MRQGKFQGVHFCNFGTYKDENKRKLNKVLLFVIMAYGEGNYWSVLDMRVIIFDRSRSKSIKVGDNCKDLTFGNFANQIHLG